MAHSLSSLAAVSAVVESDAQTVRNIILLAPACSLAGVLDRWASQRSLPRSVAAGISRELERRDGVPVSHWDIRSLGLPSRVRVRLLHDPGDTVVPISDCYAIATAVGADVEEVAQGAGHHGILDSDEMRAALAACAEAAASRKEFTGGSDV